MKKAALVIMACAPEAGKVKTRLQPALTPARCAGLYEAFLRDALDLALSMEGFTPFIAYTPAESESVFERLAPAGTELIPQTGRGLGQVMDKLINGLLSRGFARAVLIGSDIPILQPETIRRSLVMLEKTDVCLGPSRDGGYYLIGAGEPVSALFQDVPWSTPEVMRVTLEKAASAGLTVGLLEELGDVDVPEDLLTLEKEIAALRKVKGSRIPERTAAWLNNNLNNKHGTGTR